MSFKELCNLIDDHLRLHALKANVKIELPFSDFQKVLTDHRAQSIDNFPAVELKMPPEDCPLRFRSPSGTMIELTCANRNEIMTLRERLENAESKVDKIRETLGKVLRGE